MLMSSPKRKLIENVAGNVLCHKQNLQWHSPFTSMFTFEPDAVAVSDLIKNFGGSTDW